MASRSPSLTKAGLGALVAGLLLMAGGVGAGMASADNEFTTLTLTSPTSGASTVFTWDYTFHQGDGHGLSNVAVRFCLPGVLAHVVSATPSGEVFSSGDVPGGHADFGPGVKFDVTATTGTITVTFDQAYPIDPAGTEVQSHSGDGQQGDIINSGPGPGPCPGTPTTTSTTADPTTTTADPATTTSAPPRTTTTTAAPQTTTTSAPPESTTTTALPETTTTTAAPGTTTTTAPAETTTTTTAPPESTTTTAPPGTTTTTAAVLPGTSTTVPTKVLDLVLTPEDPAAPAAAAAPQVQSAVADPGTAGNALPKTGSNATPLMALGGLAFMLLGVNLLLMGRLSLPRH